MPDAPDPFTIRAHVPDWDACVADYREASAATRSALPARLGVPFGSHPDETLDLFFPAAVAGSSDALRPVHMFVHGGYWRAFSKDDYSFVADSIIATGAIAAVIDYSLMPGARMPTLVGQVRAAARWLAQNAASFGGDAMRLTASGHSAGAHLTSYLVCRGPRDADGPVPQVRSVLLVSGLYDLDPVSRSFLQPEVGFTAEEIADWSPLKAAREGSATVQVAVGDRETRPFLDQARAFADRLADGGIEAPLSIIPGEDHMTVVRELGRPGTRCAALLERTIGGP